MNGMCRYSFPRFCCKHTILAQPLPLTYANEEEKKIKEKDIADKNKKAKDILEEAKKVLNRNDLESEIERKVLKLKILPNWSDYSNQWCTKGRRTSAEVKDFSPSVSPSVAEVLCSQRLKV